MLTVNVTYIRDICKHEEGRRRESNNHFAIDS